MVITHDDRIAKLFNKRIRIIKPDNNNDVIKNGYMVKCEWLQLFPKTHIIQRSLCKSSNI